MNLLYLRVKKSKVILLQAWFGPEGGYSSMAAALVGYEWSAARPGRTLPRERPGTHFTGGWVGPRAGLKGRKISSPPEFDPGPSSRVAQSLYQLSYPAVFESSVE